MYLLLEIVLPPQILQVYPDKNASPVRVHTLTSHNPGPYVDAECLPQPERAADEARAAHEQLVTAAAQEVDRLAVLGRRSVRLKVLVAQLLVTWRRQHSVRRANYTTKVTASSQAQKA